MPEFRTIKEVEAELTKYIPIVKEITGKHITLERIEPLMQRLGHPQRKLNIIHVAGTSGKTSTSYYLAAMMKASVGKVGLTVSPHIDSLTERVQVNGQALAEDIFCRAFGEFMVIIAGVDPEPSYFELLIGFMYWYFAKAGMGWVVVETGLGGLHDATNVAQQPEKICVITDIGFDHVAILGHTFPEIAAQKAGIIHKGNSVYMYEQNPEVTAVFHDKALNVEADLQVFDQTALQKQLDVPGLERLPLYQQRNWLLARAAYAQICANHGLVTDEQKLLASLAVQVPGRMDVWHSHGKTIAMDGAHNEQKMKAFVESLAELYPDQKATVLLSMKVGKEYQAVLPMLKPFCKRLVITTFDVLQDLPSKSIEPKVLADAAHSLGFEDVEIIEDIQKALSSVLEAPGELVVITGSFYLLSVVRPLIMKS